MTPKGKDGLYTPHQLSQFYVRFNAAYFGGTLPLPAEISYCDAMTQPCRDAVACVSWEGLAGCYHREYRIYLLRPFFQDKDTRLLLCALLHEMVHIYLHRFAAEEIEDHGPLFRAACQKLQRVGWNVDSFLNPNLCAFELRDRRSDASRPFLGVISLGGRFVRELLRRR